MPPGVSTQMELDPVHKESIRICLWRSQAPLPVDDGTFLFRGLVFTLHPTLQCLNCGVKEGLAIGWNFAVVSASSCCMSDKVKGW
ncbi:uncharacterized protein ACBT44_010473 isoform 7-T7 [Syngnathus typhle]